MPAPDMPRMRKSLLRTGLSVAGVKLVGTERSNEEFALRLTFRSEVTVVVVLCLADSRRPCLARTKSFDLFHRSVDKRIEPRAAALVCAIASHIAPCDPGGLGI